MKRILIAFTFIALFIGNHTLFAQQKVLTIDDYAQWSRITGTQISTDGNWTAYTYSTNDDNDTLYVKALNTDTIYEIPNATRAQFSKNNQWVSYTISPNKNEQKKQKSRTPEPNKAELLNLSTGDKLTVGRAGKQAFSNNSSYWVVLRQKNREDKSEHKGSDMVVHNLKNNTSLTIGYVTEFEFNKKASHLAYLIDSENKFGNGLYLFDLSSGENKAIDTDTLTYTGLSWDDSGAEKEDWGKKGNNIAVLKGTKPKKKEFTENTLVVVTNLNKNGNVAQLDANSMPDNLIASESRNLSWTDDSKYVLFGMREQQENVSYAKDSTANVDVFHWNDPKIQTVQMQQYNRDARFTYVGSYNTQTNAAARLTDDEVRNLNISTNSEFMVGSDDASYIDDINWGVNPADYYRINIATGEKTRFATEINRTLGYSPDGRYYLYQKVEDGEASLLVMDLKTNKITNISEKAPVSFIDAEYIYDHEGSPYGLAGWAKDGKSVIVNHKYDLWQLALDGSKATNITQGEGEKEQIVFRYISLDSAPSFGFGFGFGGGPAKYIDTKKPLMLSAYGDINKNSGFYSLNIGKSPKKLVFEDVRFGRPMKAENADVVLVTKETFVDFPDYYATNQSFKNLKRVTDANPQQAEYAWGSRKLIEFENGKGKTVQGTLTLPANYEPGKRYPTIIYFYETMSERHNQYSMPVYDDRPHMSTYASDGYMVFMPDMYFEIGYPGTSSLDGITSAAQAIIDQGYADPDNIGLQGHSWGGYQTSFILTQTDMFKTIVTGAPPTNLASFYNNIYGSTGTNHHGIMETGQVRMGRNVTPWSSPEAYERENPMVYVPNISTPFLLLHGTADGAVDWSQGLEFYNAARRMGKEVIFLSYPDEGHHLANRANQIDFQTRMKEYFDYHLKGAEAPDWMINGVPQLEKKYRKAK